MRNVTPCRLDVKDRSALISMATQSLATSEHKTPHTLSQRSAVFSALRKSNTAVALVRLNSDILCLFPSDSDLSEDRGHVKDNRVRITAISTLQPTETSEDPTSEDYTDGRAVNLTLSQNLPQNERKWLRQVS